MWFAPSPSQGAGRPASAVRLRVRVAPVVASVLPGRRAGEVLAKVVAQRLEEVAVRAEAEQEDPKVVLRARLAVGARVLRARRLRVRGADGNQQGELDRRLDLARVGRAVKEAVLDRVLAAVPKVVEVEGAGMRRR